MKKIKFLILTQSIGLYLNLFSYIAPKKASKKAFALFSEPRKGKLNSLQLPTHLQDAELITITSGEDAIQTYYWKGNQNVVLLVHGWESNSARWKKLLNVLKQSGTSIVAIDAPAHGLSNGTSFDLHKYKEFIHLAVQKYQVNYLIGHSFGGKACLYYQSIYQNPAIKKIVSLGAPSDFKIILKNYLKMLGLNSTIAKGMKELYQENFNIDSDLFSTKSFVSTLNTKGLIAHDTDDTIVLINEAEKIASGWKTATFIKTKGLGHSLHSSDLYKKVVHFLLDTNSH